MVELLPINKTPKFDYQLHKTFPKMHVAQHLWFARGVPFASCKPALLLWESPT